MRLSRSLFLTILCGCSGVTGAADGHDPDASAPARLLDASADDGAAPIDGGAASDGGSPAKSAGCGRPARDAAGGVQRTLDAGAGGDGVRSYYLSIPAAYDPSKPHRLIVGYPGTDWTGKQIQPYLDLETDKREDEIFVYLDPLWRDFAGWGHLGGWLLGPNAAPANGNQDLVFTSAVLDDVESNYCIDTSHVFATGHSWGGDMAQVVSCFLGERFAASVPVAANRPYWFERADGSKETCSGHTAVWTMFGIGDDHFTEQTHPGEFGDECRDFWLATARCTGASAKSALPYGSGQECFDFLGCDRPTRYCLYDPATKHQRPAYYAKAAMTFFRGF